MAAPTASWPEELGSDLLRLRNALRFVEPALIRCWSMCIFCRTPGKYQAYAVRLDGNSWALELPDGHRLHSPHLPESLDKFPELVICDTCARVVDYNYDPQALTLPDVSVTSCSRCEAWILIPSWGQLIRRWIGGCRVCVDPEGDSVLGSHAVLLCLACQRQLWKRRLVMNGPPWRTQPERAPERTFPTGTVYCSYELDREPEALPVVYDPQATSPTRELHPV